jgi:hypothetical protein
MCKTAVTAQEIALSAGARGAPAPPSRFGLCRFFRLERATGAGVARGKGVASRYLATCATGSAGARALPDKRHWQSRWHTRGTGRAGGTRRPQGWAMQLLHCWTASSGTQRGRRYRFRSNHGWPAFRGPFMALSAAGGLRPGILCRVTGPAAKPLSLCRPPPTAAGGRATKRCGRHCYPCSSTGLRPPAAETPVNGRTTRRVPCPERRAPCPLPLTPRALPLAPYAARLVRGVAESLR